MSHKRSVYLSQISTQYGDSLFLPYSAGLLQAYAQSIPAIRDAYAFKGFLVGRSHIPMVVSRLETPAVLGLSCYVWNWEYSKALAQAVKAAYPDCLIVLGGPQVPNTSEGFFVEHPYIDLLVHGEGEVTFAEILQERLNYHPAYDLILGLSQRVFYQEMNAYWTHKTSTRERLKDLSQLPSPYLTGVFDELVKYKYDWVGSWETNRGCPYSCDMCDWGSATLSKVYAFDEERLKAELTWFGQHKIRYLYACDANFGILARDITLTEALIKTKRTYGYPVEYRACTAKNSGERVFAIAERLHAAGMHKGATMSMQSMDAHTLQTIHRSNIKTDDFAYWMRRYHDAGIATYTELIMGLPGETYESFKRGIDNLLEAGQHEHLSIYLLQCLPNSELSDPAYRTRHGLQTVRTPLLLQHSTITTEALQEQEEIVIATNTMPLADWKRTYLFAWAVQTFHCLGLTRCVAIYLHEAHGVAYSAFYETLCTWASAHPDTLIGQQYAAAARVMERALAGGSWDVVMPEAGPIVWPSEEASFLALVRHLVQMYVELDDLLCVWEGGVGQPIVDLLRYQQAMVVAPDDGWEEGPEDDEPIWVEQRKISLGHNWHTWLQGILRGGAVELRDGQYELQIRARGFNSFEQYAREVVWFGRKSGAALHETVKESRLDK